MRVACLVLSFVVLGGCVSTRQPPPTVTETGEPIPRYRARMATDLAIGYFQRQQYAVALEELDNAVKHDAGYAPTYSVLGLTYYALKDEAKAEQNYRRALSLDAKNGDFRNNFGTFLCNTRRERESLAEFDAAIENTLYTSPEAALLNAGKCAQRAGLIRKAEEYYQRLMSQGASPVEALQGLAEVTYKTSRFDEARRYLKAAANYPQTSPVVLYMGACVERRLGDLAAEASYQTQLKNRYPNAPETARALAGNCDT